VLFLGIALGQAAAAGADVAKSGAALASIYEILDRGSSVDPLSDEGEKPSNAISTIELRNVTFSYPTRTEAVALKNFSIKIEKGKSYALVGSSGSGKSTSIGLIERFYDVITDNPEVGVFIDGKNIKDLNVAWLRSQVGLISQDSDMFAKTIRENLMYGNPEATEEELREACRVSNCLDFIEDFDEGFDTFTGNKELMSLSGGQAQRVSIARTLLKRPNVLLLDEPTSALSNKDEEIVQKALDKVVAEQKLTTITIAHRLSTIKNVDKIIVLSHGKIVEVGTWEGLIAKKGRFYKLYSAQTKQGT